MLFNTKIRLTVLAAAIALASGSSAFAQDAGKWQGGIHTDPSHGAVDDGARHTKDLMDKKVVPSGGPAANTGTWQGGIHTDPATGSADAPAARHTKEVMAKQAAPSTWSNVASYISPPPY